MWEAYLSKCSTGTVQHHYTWRSEDDALTIAHTSTGDVGRRATLRWAWKKLQNVFWERTLLCPLPSGLCSQQNWDTEQ
jgi:hypothetical protein